MGDLMLHKKRWICREVSEEDILRVSQRAGISRFLAKIFLSRGIEDETNIKGILNPSLELLHDPFLLNDMKKAVDRIKLAIDRNEKIVVYGDYDVDGITSTSVLYNFLSSRKADVDYYIPDRLDEGYGLSTGAVDRISETNASLIITVDCGITAIDEINYIKYKNMDVIVTDHHECKEELPDAYAVICPCRPDSSYPFSQLAGVGVVFKLIHALCIEMGLGSAYLDYLDLVALGTVADVVPLVDENRVIVSFGIQKIMSTANVGLRKLMENCNYSNKPITSWTIGFVFAPRINAAGRIGDARIAVRLLTTYDEEEANDIVALLDDDNRLRQSTEVEILNEAVSIIEGDESYLKEKVLIVAGEKWHHGVIGIVASRITDRYHKPCILFSKEDMIAKGSGRSIEGFDLFKALCHCRELIEKFGGHELAAGLTVSIDNLPAFRKMINEYADSVLNEEDLVPKLEIDARIDREDISIKNIMDLNSLAPFGAGNPTPVFIYRNLRIINIRTVGDNKHLKLKLRDSDTLLDAIGFNMGDMADVLRTGDMVDVACTLEMNSWNSVDTIQLNIRDMRLEEEAAKEEQYFMSLDRYLKFDEWIDEDRQTDVFGTGMKRISRISINELVNMAESAKSMAIVVNNPDGALLLENLLKKMSTGIKKKLEVCYTIPYNVDFDKIYLVVNPDPDHMGFDNLDNVVFFGNQVSESYIKRLMSKIGNKGLFYFGSIAPDCMSYDDIIPDRKDMVAVYQYIKANSSNNVLKDNLFMLSRRITNNYKINMNFFKLKRSLEVFDELKLIEYREAENGKVLLLVADNVKTKTNLENSKSYRYLQQLKAKLKEA